MMAMGRALPSAAALLAAALIVAGCGSGEETGEEGVPSGPTLVPVDSIRLAESDSVYIGKPAKPNLDPHDGSYYVPDLFSKEVYRFARDGRLLRVYGRAGEGPGEFQWPGAVFVPDDSTVAVVAQHRQKLSFFDRSTGAHRRERRLPGLLAQEPPLVVGDTVWMSVMRPGVRKGLVRYETGRDTTEWIGRLPSPILASLEGPGRYARFFSWLGHLAGSDGRIIHGFRVLNWVFVRDREGAVVDSVYVPEARRRGVPSDLREEMDAGNLDLMDAHEETSVLFGLQTLPDGTVALEHQDWTLLNRDVIPPPAGATVWISLLSGDLERACVDARLSDSEDAKPMAAFRGDTVFHLERRIAGRDAAGEARDGSGPDEGLETWLRIVRIDPSGCDWIPARPPEG